MRLVVREGCIGETRAALEAREAAAHAADPALARLLDGIADDESQHAALAWRFLGWALPQAPAQLAAVVREELQRAAPAAAAHSEPSADELALALHGVLSPALTAELRARAFADVIEPCAAAILAPAGDKRREMHTLSA